MRFTLRCVQCMATSVFWGADEEMLGGQKFASDTEVQSVVRHWLGQQRA